MMERIRSVRLCLLAAAPFALTTSAVLANVWTNPTVGNWAIGSNWSQGVPTSGQTVDIDDGGLALITSAGAVANYFVLGSVPSLSQSGFLDIQGAGRLTVGSGGLHVNNGTMQIDSGGQATVGSTQLGDSPYVGTIIVTGANSYLNSGSLSLYSGGSLRIESGGRTDSGTGSFAANLEGGSATVTGLNSLWSINGNLFAGGITSAQVTVSNRGTVNAGSTLITADSQVIVDGAGSSLNNTSGATTTHIGASGNGGLVVRNGGLATSVNADVGLGTFAFGTQFTGGGTADITGTGSTWNNSADIAVGTSTVGGGAGTGTMIVDSGGRVTSATAEIGVQADSFGQALLSGTGSTWANSGDIALGQSGVGWMGISGGAKVTNFRAHLGFNSGATGLVLVHDPGSTWTGGGSFFIGNGGSGVLSVYNGGVVSTAGNSYLGFSAGASGTVLVSGSGSAMNTAATVAIGGNLAAAGGQGKLRIENGGTVNTGSTLLYSSGVLELSDATTFTGPVTSFGGLVRTFGDTAVANNITLGAGGINVSTQTAGATSTFSGAISGTGGLSYSAADPVARLRLTGNSNYSGATTLNSGTLAVDGSITSATQVSSGATLSGSGTVGPIDIANGGTISPGNGVGILTAGDTTFHSGGIYKLALRNDGVGSPGADWSSLAVNGVLDISTIDSGGPFTFQLQSLDSANNPNPLDTWDPAVSHTWSSIVGTTAGLVGDFDSGLFQVDATGFQNATSGTFSVVQNGTNLDLEYLVPPPPPTPGDFDGDGIVGPGDYDVWAATFGSSDDLRADANNDGIVDAADYTLWRDHLGQVVGAGSGAAGFPLGAFAGSLSPAVPEPTTLVMLLAGIITICCSQRARVS